MPLRRATIREPILPLAMRRPIVLALSLLAAAAPAAAAAATAPGSGHAAGGLFGKLVAASPLAKPGVPGDGRLAIENGRGTVVLSAVGGVVATFDSGDLLVDDPVAGDGSGIVITGADFTRRISSTSTLYRGENVHVLVKSDRFRIRIRAVGIYLGAVGH